MWSLALPAFAIAEGTPPQLFADAKGQGGRSVFVVKGSVSSIGDSLLAIEQDQYVNATVLDQTQSLALLTMPNDGTVVAAYLFWGASAYAAPLVQPQPATTAMLYVPSGAQLSSSGIAVQANNCQTFASFSGGIGDVGPAYYCRADVTDVIKQHPPAVLSSNGANLEGLYGVDGHALQSQNLRNGVSGNGGIGSCNFSADRYSCQSAFAGWTLVVIYASPTAPSTRDVAIYDGFLRLDEQYDFNANGVGTGTSGILAPQTLGGFVVGASHAGELTLFGMEGDPQLGHDGFDVNGIPFPEPPANADFMQLGGSDLRGGVAWPPSTANMLQGPGNPWGNLFNSSGTQSVSHRGIDFDKFNVTSFLSPGQTTITLQPGSGDGVPNPGYSVTTHQPCPTLKATGTCSGGDTIFSNGEYFLLGWTMLALDTVAPDFSRSTKAVDLTSASPGDTVQYTIKVLNTGKATTTTVQDLLPANVTYVPGSTTAAVPGLPITFNIPDKGTQSGLSGGGFTIPGQVGPGFGNLREVDFTLKAKINDNTFGQQICNKAQINSPDLSVPVSLVTNPCTLVASPSLATPSLVVRINGAASTTAPHLAQPGDVLTYVATLTNTGDATARNVAEHVDLPKFTKSFQLLAQGDPSASFAQTATSFDLTGVTISARSSIQVVWQVTVFSPPEFGGTAIDGLSLPEQLFQILGGVKTASDDPATAASSDPTTVVLRYAADLSSSAKVAVGGSGGFVQPGDTITYTISLVNSGNRPATVTLADPLPAGTGPCTVVQPAGATCSATSFDAQVAVGAGATVKLVFTTQVRADAANGLVIRNVASVNAPEIPAALALSSNALTVRSVVDLGQSAKTVRDLTSGASVFFPGDVVEYTVVAKNSGSQAATGVRVDDAIPANLVYVPGSAQPAASFDGAALHWSSADLAAGASATFVFRAQLAGGVANGTVVTNTAQVSSAQAQAAPQASFKVTSSPLFTASTKTVQDIEGHPLPAVKPGDHLLYTLAIKNTGTSAATSVSVQDALDPLLTFQGSTSGTFANGTVTWQLPAMQPGDVVTLQFSAQLAPAIANGRRIDNLALVSAAELSQPQPTQTASVTVASTGSLAQSTKTFAIEAPGTPLPGRKVTYTITVQDTGDSPADDVVVTDPLPACLGGGTMRWDKSTTPALAHVVPGQGVVLTFVATIAQGTADGTACDNAGRLASSTVPGALTSVAHFVVVSKPELVKSTKAVALLVDANGDGKFSPGDRVQYTITVVNSGTADASSVQVQDALPPQLANPSPAPPLSIGALAPGASKTVTFDADIAAGTPDATQVCNTAQLQTPELAGATPTTQACFAVDSHPKLAFTKALAGSHTRKPGDTLVYTLALQNTGTAPATQLKLTDAIDSHFVFVSAAASGGGIAVYDVAASSVSVAWSAPLAPGATDTVTITARLGSAIDNGTLVPNQARATAAELASPLLSDDPSTPAANDPTVVTVVSGADFSASLKAVARVPAGPVHPGDRVHYDLTITNTGNADAHSVVVTDPLDARLSVVSPIPAGGVLSNGVITWTLSQPIAAGSAPVTLSFDAFVAKPLPNGTVIANQASINALGLAQPQLTSDPSAPGTRTPTTFTLVSAPDLSTSLKSFTDTSRADGTVHPGDSLTFAVQPTNTGDAEAGATTITDVLDPGLVFVSAGQGGAYDAGTRTVRWTLPKIGLDPVAPLSFVATVVKPLANGTLVKNQARLAQADGAAWATNTVQLTVVSAPDLSGITKIVQSPPQLVTPGTVLTYAIRVPNNGDAAATAVAITDAIDPALDQVTPLDGGTLSGSTLTWTVATLAPGDAAVVRFSARVRPLTANGTVVSNQARVTAAELSTPQLSDDPGTPAPHDPTRVVVTSAPDLSTTTKTAAVVGQPTPGLLRPGDTVRYTITVANTGNTFATRVIVRDPLDPLLVNPVAEDAGRVEGNAVVWDSATTPAFAQLGPGAPVTLHFTAQVGPLAHDGDFLANQAQLSEDEGIAFVSDDPATPAPRDATVLQVRFADLRALKTVQAVVPRADGTVHPGDQVDWIVQLSNRGSFPATHVTLTDAIDPVLVEIAPQAGGALSGGTLTWTEQGTPQLAQLSPGATLTLGFRARIKALTRDNTRVANQAIVRAVELNAPVPSDDPATPAPRDPTVLVIRSAPDLRATTKTVANLTRRDGTYRPGDQVQYAIAVRNAGDTWATSVVVRDAIDPGLAGVSGPLVWDETTVPALAQVMPGDVIALSFTARVAATTRDGQVVLNQAQLAAQELVTPQLSDDPSTPAAGDATAFTVVAGPRLSRSIKTVTDVTTPAGPVRPGDVLEYQLTVLNDGTDPATNTVLTDAPPPQTRYVPGTTRLNGALVADAAGQSALEQGLRVSSLRAGTPAGTVLASTGAVPDDTAAHVSFRVRVADDAVAGTVISNQGQLRADKVPQAATDDPTTPAPGDATVVVVGSAPVLQALKTWRLVVDQGAAGVVDPGDTIEYAVEIQNRGTARADAVALDDDVPAGTAYTPGTLALDGAPLTDLADGDAGDVTRGRVHATFGALVPGQRRVLTFRVRITGGSTVSNQGHVTSSAGPDQLTDGDPSLPGDQPTVTPVSAGARADLTGSKAVLDENGGDVLPGDVLTYVITVVNGGGADAAQVTLEDPLPPGLEYVAGSASGDGAISFFASTTGPGSVRASGVIVKASGGRAQLRFRARVLPGTAPGSTLTNVASLRATPVSPKIDLPPAVVVVGQAQGAAGLSGKVWQDLDGDGQFTSADRVLPGFVLLLRRADQAAILRTAASDGSGSFRLPDLPPAGYSIEAVSAEGTHFADVNLSLSASTLSSRDVLIEPGGGLYRTDDRSPIAGAQVFLRYDDAETGKPPPSCEPGQAPIAANQDVAPACLRAGQQGQRTGPLGLYRFDLAGLAAPAVPPLSSKRTLRLDVVPSSPVFQFPGTRPPAETGPGFAGKVVPEGAPDKARAPRWFRKLLLGPGDLVLNNHLALDPTSLRLTKVAARTSASAGDFVSYTVTVQNPTSQDLRVDAATGAGGVHVADALPDALRYAAGSVRALRLAGPSRLCPRLGAGPAGADCPAASQAPLAGDKGKQGPTAGHFLDFGPYDLLAGETLEVRYTALVGTSAQPGDAVNRAVARLGDVDVSNSDSATVRIAQDPLFDLASLIGRVSCGPGGAGAVGGAGAGGQGVPGVRIYEDEGYVAETDLSGKFHFKALQPGLHRFKIDERSLPPGSEPAEGALTIYLTRGLDARANFSVVCRSVLAGPDAVHRKELPPPPAPPPAPPPPVPPLAIAGDLAALRVAVDDRELLLPRGDVRLPATSDAGGPLRARTLLSTGPLPEGFRLVARDSSGAIVASAEGTGAPPPELRLEGGKADSVWRVQLELRSQSGTTLGPLHAVRFFAPAGEGKPLQEWQLRGVLFEEGTATPTRELSRQLAGPAARAAADAQIELQVEVHVAAESQTVSDLRARAVRDALISLGVPADRVLARGRGSDAPEMPNITERGRLQNRRVVVRAIGRGKPPEPPPPPLVDTRSLVAGKPVPPQFRESLPREAPVPIELQRADGSGVSLRIPPEPRPRPAALEVRVDPALAQLTLGDERFALPLLSIGVGIEGDPSLTAAGKPRDLSFALDVPIPDVASWELSVDDSWKVRGDSAVPLRVPWPVKDSLKPGTHTARLVVRDRAGGEGRSGPVLFEAYDPSKPQSRETIAAGALFAGRGIAVTRDGLDRLRKLLPRLKAAGSVTLDVFSDDAEGAPKLTRDRADALSRTLASLGVAPARIVSRGRGAAQPVAPNATSVGRRKNSRVVLSIYAGAGAGSAATAFEAQVKVQGVAARRVAEAFAAQLPAGAAELRIEAQAASGKSATFAVPLPRALPAEAALDLPPLVALGLPGAAPRGDAQPGALELPPLVGFDRADGGTATSVLTAPGAGATAGPPAGLARVSSGVPGELPAPLAANLSVELPPPGAVIRSDALWLRGSTDPRNKLTLNGAPVKVDAAGRFEQRLAVSRGLQKIAFVNTDPDGNTATLERELRVDPDGVFVLFLGEGDVGQAGAQLAGVGDRYDGAGYFLKGRASGIVDGRWDTSARLGGFFKEVRLTGQLDTSRRNDQTYFRELVDPARFYPIDGDSGTLTQEAASRGPVYLRLQADESKLIAGDFRTQLTTPSEQLFRYDRTLYGVDLDLAKKTGAVESRVTGFVAQGDLRTRHAHAELRGTGGSVYWLRHPDIVEGSERVRLVLRDSLSGMEILRVDRARDLDYTLRAAEGRLLFKQPIPSTSDASLLVNANFTTPLGGNPLFVVVDYEYRGNAGDGRGAGGVHVEETLFGAVSAGGGFVRENPEAGASYQLAGLNLGWKPRPRTFVTLEAAQSKGADAESYASTDGGMTFGTLGANCLNRGVDRYACFSSGTALRAEASAELSDWTGDTRDVLRGTVFAEKVDPGFYANGVVNDQATLKGGVILRYLPTARTQLQARLDLVQADLWTSFDPAAAQQQSKRAFRRFVDVQVTHALTDKLTLAGELMDTYTFDDQLGRAFTDQLLLSAQYKATQRLTLSLSQEADIRADERQYPHAGDRVATTLGATWKLSDSLYAQLGETLRWSGENATLFGLRAPLFDTGSVYANERLSLRSGKLLSTSVLGAEDHFGPTLRTYGEYQLDGLAEGNAQRAVLGLVNRWQVLPGVFASVAFEHAQVLGRSAGLVPGASPGATLGGVNGLSPIAGPALNPQAACIPGSTGAGSTGLGGAGTASGPPQQGGSGTCAPSLAIGSGFNPAGGYFPGTAARDAGSASIELFRDTLKASAKAEVRRDKADPSLTLLVPGSADRLHLVFFGDATAKWTDDLGVLARLHWADSIVGKSTVEAQWLEATVGLALRPARRDTFNALFKLTHLLDQRPLDLTSGLADEQVSDVISVSPTLELPWHLALAGKLAFKHVRSRVADGPELSANLLLWVNRLDWHLKSAFDLSGEFRWMLVRGPIAGGTGGDSERGFLVEAAYRANRFSRIGFGYNFTSFSDDELARYDRSQGGFFVRAVGEY